MSVEIISSNIRLFGNLPAGAQFYRISNVGRFAKCMKMEICDKTEKRPMNAVDLHDGFQCHLLPNVMVEIVGSR